MPFQKNQKTTERTLRRQTAGATDHPAGGSEENVPPINGETAASP